MAGISQDNSAWGDTPQDKLLRLQQAGTAMIEAAEHDQNAKAKAEAVDRYNEAHRSQSLLEKHKDKQKKVPNIPSPRTSLHCAHATVADLKLRYTKWMSC